MARVDVIMPQMGESIAEGTLSRWLKKVGDEVKRDEPIFEISTDKVDAEIPAPSAGTIVEIIVHEGTTVPVNAVVARIETEKGAAVAAPAAPAAPAPAPAAAAPSAPAAVAAAPSAPAAAAKPSAPAGSFEERVRTKSSPLVRRMAADAGVDISTLNGSGIAGRVTRKDFEAYLASGAKPAAAPSPVTGAMPAGLPSQIAVPAGHVSEPTFNPWPGDVVEPMNKIRKLTADHMRQARQVAAHVTSFFEIDLTRVAKLRAQMKADFERESGQKLTYLPFIIRSVVENLRRHPVLNATVSGTDVILRKRYNIGIAVALEPTGLIVPVLKDADGLNLTGLTRGTNDLAQRARSKKLSPMDVQDATFTITNPGVFGSLFGTPIIPVGTTAILGLGAIEKRPKVITGADGEDTIAIRTCAYFSLSFDHRVVDGADADRFMADLKKTLESVTN
ncbi:dihydrolipoamide acetyltransferase family protein [Pseudogemmatithrix spongiicola]|uniref:Dihydrolipoamide acetyltransferase component of pyruvate dehydrogenase complex n=1 Tax=Pseudogemmatithrix spongiicola TaxID=3062599 RepID=A0AA49K122_9BACT|nr:dihydrolipoamide acetyltransferase family protein [Gemmatimonadaceae bacterium 'strain 138']WKW15473.1 dihydrolipoamide acetyltransferase family protein [Gemmatimonadaceae bacterium 'strain 318']